MLVALATVWSLAVPVPSALAGPVGPPVIVASGLDHPWDIILVPGGRTWVTERACDIRDVSADGTLRTIYTDPAAGPGCEFLGLTLSPGYSTNHFVYLVETSGGSSGNPGDAFSRIVRLVDDGTDLGCAHRDLRWHSN